jgi:hypothetical protein
MRDMRAHHQETMVADFGVHPPAPGAAMDGHMLPDDAMIPYP